MSLQSTARSDTRSSTPPACVRPCPCSSPLLTSWTRTPCSKTTAARSAPPPRPRRPPPSASRDAKDGTKSPGPDALHRPVALRSSVRHARCTRSHRCTPGAAGARRCGRTVWHSWRCPHSFFFMGVTSIRPILSEKGGCSTQARHACHQSPRARRSTASLHRALLGSRGSAPGFASVRSFVPHRPAIGSATPPHSDPSPCVLAALLEKADCTRRSLR